MEKIEENEKKVPTPDTAHWSEKANRVLYECYRLPWFEFKERYRKSCQLC